MKIRYIEISGFKGLDYATRIFLEQSISRQTDRLSQKNKLFIYKTIHGILFGFNNWQKEIFRGDPSKNHTFTGLINIQIDNREFLIERDFETNFVAFVSIHNNRLRTIYQGKDIILNGSHKVYLNAIKNLIPEFYNHLNEILKNLKEIRLEQQEPLRLSKVIPDEMETLARTKDDQTEYPDLRLYIPEKKKHSQIKSILINHPYLFYDLFNKTNKPTFLWALNPDLMSGSCIEANRAACELTEYSLNELKSLSFLDIISPKTKKQFALFLQELLDKGQLSIELEIQTKDARITPVAIDAHTFFIEKQQVILSIVEDISEREKIAFELQNSHEKYKALFDNAKNAVLLMDGTKILDCNLAMEKLLELPKEDIIGKEFSSLCNQIQSMEKGQEIPSQIKNFLKVTLADGKKCFECQFIKSDGTFATAEVCFSTLQLQNKVYVQAIIQDISEFRKIEQELKNKNIQFQNFFQNTLVGIWRMEFNKPIPINQPPETIADAILHKGIISECNQAFLDMYHIKDPAKIIGQSPSIFSLDIDQSISRLSEFVKNDFKADLVESVEADLNGKLRYFNNSYVGYVEDDTLKWMWGLQIDVTEKKELEEQFLQSQKMEAIGMLAGGIAHDFNNILTVINGYSDMLLRRLDADDPLVKYITHIRKAGERASHLTGQLLSFSRKQVFQTKAINLNTTITNMISMIQRIIGEHIEIVTRLSSNLNSIKFDESKIEQIIMNMIVNAKDAMLNGGKLFIETRNVYLDEDYCTRHPEAKSGDYVLLSITDTGRGMDEDVLQHIFEPFFTTKEKGAGTGLGLATVYGIVKQADGHISVHSQEEQGTTFFIYFPKSNEAPNDFLTQDDPKMLLNDLRGSETILVVEDDQTVRQVVVETLSNHGYHVLEAINGSEALEIYSLNSQKIDLIISDVVMPRMDGKQFRQKIIKLNPDCNFIFMSGYTDTSIMNFEELESIEFLQKPFKLTELLRKVRSMFNKKSEIPI